MLAVNDLLLCLSNQRAAVFTRFEKLSRIVQHRYRCTGYRIGNGSLQHTRPRRSG
ncbi:hypothetical protein D3C72_2415040 [compost metagenome]